MLVLTRSPAEKYNYSAPVAALLKAATPAKYSAFVDCAIVSMQYLNALAYTGW